MATVDNAPIDIQDEEIRTELLIPDASKGKKLPEVLTSRAIQEKEKRAEALLSKAQQEIEKITENSTLANQTKIVSTK